jgi:hypothetical protein
MNKKAKIVLSENVKDEVLREVLEKLLIDLDDFLFGKTEMHCLLGACIIGSDGEELIKFFSGEFSQKINDEVFCFAETAQRNWLDDPRIDKIEIGYDHGLFSWIMGEGDSVVDLGIGFCVDSPYGQEALDVFKTVILRAKYDYQLATKDR